MKEKNMTSWKDKDNKNIRGPKDSTKVSMDEQWEVDYWCEKFGVTEEELAEAVDEVGDLARDVEEYLSNK
jgi:hypothetical protein